MKCYRYVQVKLFAKISKVKRRKIPLALTANVTPDNKVVLSSQRASNGTFSFKECKINNFDNEGFKGNSMKSIKQSNMFTVIKEEFFLGKEDI